MSNTSEERVKELEALVEPLPVDAEGHKLTLGMTVFVERAKGRVEARVLGLDRDHAKLALGGWTEPGVPCSAIHRDKPPEPKPPGPVLDAEGQPIVIGEIYTYKNGQDIFQARVSLIYDDGKVCITRPANPPPSPAWVAAPEQLYRGWGPTLRELRETLSAKSAAAGLGKWPQERVAPILGITRDVYRQVEEGERWIPGTVAMASLYRISEAEISRACQRTMFKLERTTNAD